VRLKRFTISETKTVEIQAMWDESLTQSRLSQHV